MAHFSEPIIDQVAQPVRAAQERMKDAERFLKQKDWNV